MRTLISVVLASLAFACVTGQDAADEVFKATGKTVDDFKVEFNHPQISACSARRKPDLSTPSAVVKALCEITDDRDSFRVRRKAVRAKWDNLARTELEKYESKLLSEAALKELAEYRTTLEEAATQASDSRLLATEVDAETKCENGDVRVNTSQREVLGEDGSVIVTHTRYTCRHTDEGWRVHSIEILNENNEEPTWEKSAGPLSYAWYYRRAAWGKELIPGLLQYSPEAAAMSLLRSLCWRQLWMEYHFYSQVMDSYFKAVGSLLTKELNEEMEQERAEIEPLPVPEPKVDAVRDGQDGTKIVRFLPAHDHARPLEIHLLKESGTWRVTGAYTVEKNEDGEESPKRLPTVYDALGQ